MCLRSIILLLMLLALVGGRSRGAETATVDLPVAREHYAASESVELAVFCPSDATTADFITLEIRHADGSAIEIDLPLDVSRTTSRTRLLSLHANTLKPGAYTAAVKGGAREKPVHFWIHPAAGRNAFRIGQWVQQGATAENALVKGGWGGMNTDYVALPPRKPAPGDLMEAYVAASMQPFAQTVCGPGHQLDEDPLNDWGDPWVQRSVAWRCQLAALSNRIYPLAGLQVFGEPALTWWPIRDAAGKGTASSPFIVPHQLAEYKRLTGVDLPVGPLEQTLPLYAGAMPDWLAFMEMRMKYLSQAWYASVWGTHTVSSRLLPVNEVSCSYAPHDVTDGVDSRQTVPYTLVSGHGQYSDLPFGTLQPLRGCESFRGFSWDKPHIYLPMWYPHTWATLRAAVWMSWATKLEGLLYTPELDFAMDNRDCGYFGTDSVFEAAEINRRLNMVGGTMSQMPKTPAPVAVLQSHTQVAWDIAMQNQPQLAKVGPPAYASLHREAVNACFFRILETGMIPNVLDEAEVVAKGLPFLRQWPVVFCPQLATATPAFQQVLEAYTAAGGKLIQFRADKLQIAGATRADHTFGNSMEYYARNVQFEMETAAKAHERGDAAAEAAANVAFARANTDLAWRHWNKGGAPNFAVDLSAWLGPQWYTTSNPQVLLNIQHAGDTHLLLLANNAQSLDNPRTVKHELVAAETTITVPPGGVVYNLFKGGAVPLTDNRFTVRLAAGDGACYLRLPQKVSAPDLQADLHSFNSLRIKVFWGKLSYLPLRLRVMDPAGNVFLDGYRATAPGEDGIATLKEAVPLGINAAPGKWRIEVSEWLTDTRIEKTVTVREAKPTAMASLDSDQVSVYFDDAEKIVNLLAGKPLEPDWAQLNPDAARVFAVNSRKFAIFAIEERRFIAERIAEALQAKGFEVVINPPYAITPFAREAERGGAGPMPWSGNLESIAANTLVLPDHPLMAQSWSRGHINRTVTPSFPGPGRAYLQWGISCYQMGYQNIFMFGDTESGATWLFEALKGRVPPEQARPLSARVAAAPAVAPVYPQAFKARLKQRTYDTPTGVGASPDGKTTYYCLYDGSVAACDAGGQLLWQSQPLLEACALAVSPKGDRIAVAGYPGLLVLKAKDGSVLDGFRAEPKPVGNWILGNRIVNIAWNSAGTRVAGGWVNNDWRGTRADPHPVVVLNADGKPLASPEIEGNVYGVSFVPGSDTLLVGATRLTAVNTADGTTLWTNEVSGAQCFVFPPDGKTAAAGGWGRNIGVFALADGAIQQQANAGGVVGGLAYTPAGELVAAVWGGTRPLYALRTGPPPEQPDAAPAFRPVPLFQSKFAFQNVLWSERFGGLVAAEQGGRLWLLTANGTPLALREDDGYTTAYRMLDAGDEILIARMNRIVQRVALKATTPK